MAESDGGVGDFAVVPAEVTDAGKYVQGVAESMINGLQSLDVDITRLLDTWQGERATDFAAGWTEAQGCGVLV